MLVSRPKDSPRVITLSIGGALLCMIALEASLLGAGRLVEIGPLTLKMYLFALAQIYVVYRVVLGAKIRPSSVILVCVFGVSLALSTMIGTARHADPNLISTDLSMSLYVVMLLFCELTICTPERVRLVSRVIEIGAVILSIVYLILLLLLFTGVVSFHALYHFLAEADNEVMFRGTDGLMEYKGAMYVAVGSMLLMFRKGKLSRFLAMFTFVAALATFARGFLVGFIGAGIAQLLTGRQSTNKKLMYAAMCVAVLIGVLSTSSPFTDARSDGDQTRITILKQVNQQITPLSIIFGQGLGEGVEVRPIHMEIAFAETFHKQGLLGLLWWGAAFGLVVWRYRAVSREHYALAQPLLLAVIFDYCLSATNPYINTPIGMFVLFVGLAGLGGLEGPKSIVPEMRELPTEGTPHGAIGLS